MSTIAQIVPNMTDFFEVAYTRRRTDVEQTMYVATLPRPCARDYRRVNRE